MSSFNIRARLGGMRPTSRDEGTGSTPTQSRRGSVSSSTATRSMGSLSSLASKNSSTTTVDKSDGKSRRLSLSDLSDRMVGVFSRRHNSLDLRSNANKSPANPPEFNGRKSAPEPHDLAKLNAVEKYGIDDPAVKSKSFLRRTFGLSAARERLDARLSAAPKKNQSELVGFTTSGKPVKFVIEYDKKRFDAYMATQPKSPSPLGYVKFMSDNGRMAKMNVSVGFMGAKPTNELDRQSENEPAFGARPPQSFEATHDALMRNDFSKMMGLQKIRPGEEDIKNAFEPGDTFSSLFKDADATLAKDPSFEKMMTESKERADAAFQKEANREAQRAQKKQERDAKIERYAWRAGGTPPGG